MGHGAGGATRGARSSRRLGARKAVPRFLLVLREGADDAACQALTWSGRGLRLSVTSEAKLRPFLLAHFTSGRVGSFVRQLHYYQFRKVPVASVGCMEFVHPQFRRDRKELLVYIRRKKKIHKGGAGTPAPAPFPSDIVQPVVAPVVAPVAAPVAAAIVVVQPLVPAAVQPAIAQELAHERGTSHEQPGSALDFALLDPDELPYGIDGHGGLDFQLFQTSSASSERIAGSAREARETGVSQEVREKRGKSFGARGTGGLPKVSHDGGGRVPLPPQPEPDEAVVQAHRDLVEPPDVAYG